MCAQGLFEGIKALGCASPTRRMLLQHEGGPLLGATAQDLPAAVREVVEVYCQGPKQVQFWQVCER